MKSSLLSLILSVVLVAAPSLVAAAPATVPNLPYYAPNPMRDKTTVVAGLNNYNCKPSAAHPRPVILVHATLLTEESWHPLFAPALVSQGYCVFALTYGRMPNIPLFAALNHVAGSAQELADFADNVLKTTNTTQVDLVGHSQGGILGRYWVNFLGGQGKVKHMIGISPINHGTTLDGIVLLGKMLHLFNAAQPIFDSFAPAFYELVTASPFMQKLNANGDTAPGVIHANIATRYDEVVTPWQTCYQNDAGVTNTLVQDLCAVSVPEHLLMIGSKVVMRWVLNQLDPANARTANCLSVFDWY